LETHTSIYPHILYKKEGRSINTNLHTPTYIHPLQHPLSLPLSPSLSLSLSLSLNPYLFSLFLPTQSLNKPGVSLFAYISSVRKKMQRRATTYLLHLSIYKSLHSRKKRRREKKRCKRERRKKKGRKAHIVRRRSCEV
jgi:hypothetical protein